jgi:hypothetical protein
MAAKSGGKKKTSVKAAEALPNKRATRDASLVRTYLKSLADSTGNSRSGNSLERVADRWNVPADDMRSFRDGRDSAMSLSLVTTISQLLGSDAAMYGYNFDPEQEPSAPIRFGSANLYRQDEAGRADRLRHYKMIPRVRPEASSALGAWADLGIIGSAAEATRVPFVPAYQGDDPQVRTALAEISDQVNTWLMPQHVKLMAFRGMCQYGDQNAEVGLEKLGPGKYDMAKLEPRDVRTIFVNMDEKGTLNPKAPYVQRVGASPTGDDVFFAPWQLARFSNVVEWGAYYGSSIFEPCLRSYIQIEAAETAMLVRRISRAALRYLRVLDVGHIQPDEIFKAVEEQKQKQRKVRTVDTSGRRGLMSIAMPTEEDLYIGKRDKDSPADVKVLEGDANIGRVEDMTQIFYPKWFAGLGPPKAHLGWEGDTMRSVITDLHIVFARKVRSMQMRFIAGLNHLYWIGLILRGIDPRGVQYQLTPPTMGTRDELVRAQIMQTYATTVKYLADGLGMTGQVPSIQWFLKYIMGLSDDAISDDVLQLKQVIVLTKGAPKNDPASGAKSGESVEDSAQMAAAALGSDEVASRVAGLGFLLGERAVAFGVEEQMGVGGRLFAQQSLMPAFAGRFDETMHQMGVRYLRRAA